MNPMPTHTTRAPEVAASLMRSGIAVIAEVEDAGEAGAGHVQLPVAAPRAHEQAVVREPLAAGEDDLASGGIDLHRARAEPSIDACSSYHAAGRTSASSRVASPRRSSFDSGGRS